MYCRSCGSVLQEGAAFCTVCGAPTAKEAPPPGPAQPEKGAKSKGWIIGIAAAVVAVVFVLVAAVSLLGGGRTPKSVATAFLKGVFEADGEAMLYALHPDMAEAIWGKDPAPSEVSRDLWDDLVDEHENDSRDDPTYYILDKDTEFSYECLGEETVDASYGEQWSEQMAKEGYDLTCSEVRGVTVETTMTNGKRSYPLPTRYILVGKVNGSWYALNIY